MTGKDVQGVSKATVNDNEYEGLVRLSRKICSTAVVSSKLSNQRCFNCPRSQGTPRKNTLFYGFRTTFDLQPVSYVVLQGIIFIRLKSKRILDGLKITHLARFLFP